MGADDNAAAGCLTGAHDNRVVAFRPKKTAVIVDCGEVAGTAEDENADARGPLAHKRPRLGTGPGEVHVFHILKKYAGLRRPETWQGKTATCTKAKAKLVLDNLRKRLISSVTVQQTFVELAREHSDDESAQRGGDLGSVDSGSLARQLGQVAFSLAKGELSEVFESDQGLHLMLRAF